jgi:hypothetical protein
LRCDLKTEVDFSCRAERTLDATTVVDFRLPCETDFRCDYSSRLCATRGGLKMQKMKSTFRKAKANEKSEKTNRFAAGADLQLRPKSACATGVGLGATVSVELCHRSGLKYLSHEFQTQGTIAARAGLKVRSKSTCVPGPWISDPRYGCHQSGLEGATGVDLCTWAMDFRPKIRSTST